jgi:hypothetical protein
MPDLVPCPESVAASTGKDAKKNVNRLRRLDELRDWDFIEIVPPLFETWDLAGQTARHEHDLRPEETGHLASSLVYRTKKQ